MRGCRYLLHTTSHCGQHGSHLLQNMSMWTTQQSPTTHHQSLWTTWQSPTTKHLSLWTTQQSPTTHHQSLRTTWQSPTTHHHSVGQSVIADNMAVTHYTPSLSQSVSQSLLTTQQSPTTHHHSVITQKHSSHSTTSESSLQQ